MLKNKALRIGLGGLVVVLLALASWPDEAQGYIEAPHSLGQVMNLSTNIMVCRVEKVDKEKNLIIYRKVRDLKGKHPEEVIRHNIGKAGFHPREYQYPMEWAEVGKTAVFFHNGGAGEMCIGTYWYQMNASGEWWTMTHGEPFLLRSFAGNVDKLIAGVVDILAGKEVILPCMVDNKDDLHLRRGKIMRVRCSLKLNDYNPKRDFVAWGGEDFRRLNGMPGFTHLSTLPRVDPEAQGISSLDMDGDGKADLCLVGASKVVLLQNGGEALNEITLPGGSGCRAAVWADYNSDGQPDLLLATAAGPRLYTNLGKNVFRDDTPLLPREAGYNLTSAAWIDANGDGRPDILLGNGYHGLRLLQNQGPIQGATAPKAEGAIPKAVTWKFEDVSEKWGLGPDGVSGRTKGDSLVVCDVNGDGKPDFLYGAGSGTLVLNTGTQFVEAKDSGLQYRPGRVGPVFGDFLNDGSMHLFVPQSDGCKLFRNDGKGKFTDVTAEAKLDQFKGYATSAAWGDVDNDGQIDLVVGCLREPNRYFRNKGDGTFEDATAKIGLNQKVFNTQAVGLVDLNNDGVLDMVFNNEGQESVVLLGNPEAVVKHSPVMMKIGGTSGVVGSKFRLLDKAGKIVGSGQVSGGDGRGGQASPLARFAVPPGAYRFVVQYSSGVRRGQDIQVSTSPFKAVIDEQTAKVE